MKRFMDGDFLLNSAAAVKLYHEYAKDMPIFDYHCHLDPREIAENKRYSNMAELWLGADHYKWQAMRNCGINERYITGDAGDREKFMKFAETMPYCIGNPLYHWTHLELRRYFGIEKLLSPGTAEQIWNECNEMLKTEEFSAKSLIKRSNVKVICTTDDPTDSLEYHRAIAEDDSFGVKVLPTFRPDKGIYIERDSFKGWIEKLSGISGIDIATLDDLQDALQKRMYYFHNAGCRLSDHSMEPIMYEEVGEEEAKAVFRKGLAGRKLYNEEIRKYRTWMMRFLMEQYSRLDWTAQLHISPMRNNNTPMLKKAGPDTGFDAIGDTPVAEPLSKLLDSVNRRMKLPRIILYNLNPGDNEILAALAGCFQDDDVAGKIQFGPAWWYNDNKDGLIRRLKTHANIGLLGRSVGMLTDSRSFLSYTRHEYYRRILCNLLGEWVENGEAPDDMDLMGEMVRNICYNNAKNYFKIEIER